MAELKYSKYIVTNPKPIPPELKAKFDAEAKDRKYMVESTHLLSVDSSIVEDFFYVDCHWLWRGEAEDTIEEPHTHDFDEVIGCIGSNQQDPQDLGGTITIWLDNEKQVLTKSCLIFVPAGTVHCPIQFNRIDRPVFFLTIAPVKEYTRNRVDVNVAAGSRAAKDTEQPKYTIITGTRARSAVTAAGGSVLPPPPPDTRLRSARILHLEDDIVKGSFYIDFVWIYEGTGGAPAPEHSHDWEELIAMVGADPEHPHDLGGPMSIDLEGETHLITKSSLVCIPKGLKHCPWKFLDIKKPTLVFTAGPSGTYTGSHRKE